MRGHACRRVSAAGGAPILQSLGAHDEISKHGHLPCVGNLSVWGSPNVCCVDFIHDPHGQGWHLDRPRFDTALVAAARTAGAEVRRAVVRCVQGVAGRWRLRIDDQGSDGGHEVGCRWLVDASGRGASLARRLGASRRTSDRLIAFTAQVESSDRADTDLHTLVEASPDGWWYTSLVPGSRRVVIYLTDADLAPRGLTRDPGAVWRADQTNGLHLAVSRGIQLRPRQSQAHFSPNRLARAASRRRLGRRRRRRTSPRPAVVSRGLDCALSGTRCGEAIDARLGGDTDALHRYSKYISNLLSDYLVEQADYYKLERRWLDRPFWQRRKTDAQRAVTDDLTARRRRTNSGTEGSPWSPGASLNLFVVRAAMSEPGSLLDRATGAMSSEISSHRRIPSVQHSVDIGDSCTAVG